MREVSQDLSFAGETRLFLRRDPRLAADDLQRDGVRRLLVVRAVDDTRAAAANFAFDPEAASEGAPWCFGEHAPRRLVLQEPGVHRHASWRKYSPERFEEKYYVGHVVGR
jgi:hypothetical protein